MQVDTPYYLIDEQKLLLNLRRIQFLRQHAGVKVVLALKCFSTWPVFSLMSQYMDGTTSSSVYEARLGHEEFGKEVHAYSVAFSERDVAEVAGFANKIIFNSLSQLQHFHSSVSHLDIGLRINPQVSYSDYPLADPARRYSRLGVADYSKVLESAHLINGAMFHYNCENPDYENFSTHLDIIAERFSKLLSNLRWVSLGGGIDFTSNDYPIEKFAQKLTDFARHFDIQVYLEPGEAVVAESTSLVTTVLDIVENEVDIAIVDSSIEAHMLDLLTYQASADIEGASQGAYRYQIAGQSCLAGDLFGEGRFDAPLKVGDQIRIADAGGYSMVKMNWFNGLRLPAIVVKRSDDTMELVKDFSYRDFKQNLG